MALCCLSHAPILPLVADINGDGKPDIVGPTVFINQFGASVVSKAGSSTALTGSAASLPAGQTLTLTATVTAASGSAVPTGTVTFLENGTSLGTGTLNASGVATLPLSTLAVGTHSITATYGGDGNFAGSTSTAFAVIITAATLPGASMVLSASPTSITVGQTTTLTATVTASSGTMVPIGVVTFLENGTSLGTGTLNASGVAMLPLSTLAAGSHSITASYPGDTNLSGSTSNTITVTVTSASAADYSLSLNPTSATVTSGGATSAITVSVTPAGGFGQAVVLACSGLPAYSTCSFSSSSVTPSGSAATTTFIVTTGVNVTALLQTPRSRPLGIELAEPVSSRFSALPDFAGIAPAASLCP